MDISAIDLNLLRVLQAVGEEGSVTLGARRLGLSQPAVSNALARLRRSLRDPLFVRSSQGMEPTPRARRLLDALGAAMGLITDGLRSAADFDPNRSEETLNLLVSDLGAMVYLPKLTGFLMAHAPGLRVRTRQLARGNYAQALEAGLADLAIGFLADPRGSLRRRHLFTDHFVCMVRRGHPVAEAGPLTLERYLRLPHAVVSRRGEREGLVTAALAGLGVERRVSLVVPHFGATPGVIAASDLAVTVPSDLLRTGAAAELTGLPLPFAVPEIPVAMYWHERLQHDAMNRWLREVFVRLFTRGPAEPSL